MKALNFIIVKIDEEYNNERGGLISNLDYDDSSFIAREAIVISSPKNNDLIKGDKVICHHNIFRMKGSSKGNTVKSEYHIEDNIYFVPIEECFMYKRGNEEWKTLSQYCFVKPIQEIKKTSQFILSDSEHQKNTHKGTKKLQGILKYPCKELIEFKGLKIVFSEYSEYEFIIDGELLYKMSMKDILAQIL